MYHMFAYPRQQHAPSPCMPMYEYFNSAAQPPNLVVWSLSWFPVGFEIAHGMLYRSGNSRLATSPPSQTRTRAARLDMFSPTGKKVGAHRRLQKVALQGGAYYEPQQRRICK